MSFRPPPITSRPLRNMSRGAVLNQAPVPAAAATAARGGGGGVNLKRIIWTGAFAAVTIVGTIYGAGLKAQQEYTAEKKQVAEATVEEKIAVLEQRRAALISQKMPLDKKVAELRARMKAKEIRDAGSNKE